MYTIAMWDFARCLGGISCDIIRHVPMTIVPSVHVDIATSTLHVLLPGLTHAQSQWATHRRPHITEGCKSLAKWKRRDDCFTSDLGSGGVHFAGVPISLLHQDRNLSTIHNIVLVSPYKILYSYVDQAPLVSQATPSNHE